MATFNLSISLLVLSVIQSRSLEFSFGIIFNWDYPFLAIFTEDTTDKFYRCLCTEKNVECSLNLRGHPFSSRVATVAIKQKPAHDLSIYRPAYACKPPQEISDQNNSITCFRQHEGQGCKDECDDPRACQIYHVDFALLEACDLPCINIHPTGSCQISTRSFHDNVTSLEEGECQVATPLKLTSHEKSTILYPSLLGTAKEIEENEKTTKIPRPSMTTARGIGESEKTTTMSRPSMTTARGIEESEKTTTIPRPSMTTAREIEESEKTTTIPRPSMATARGIEESDEKTTTIPRPSMTTAREIEESEKTTTMYRPSLTTAREILENKNDNKMMFISAGVAVFAIIIIVFLIWWKRKHLGKCGSLKSTIV
ncbi:LOW QUALITY PROTEIN: hypothetical protein PoB_002671000 [Plakobranchus ocellatus]|uniref:MANSC domain-containing protein n=1 Tax=Plakobranchus ocellatus TaxID=259542 RepID=A0AAV3ZWF3_9GAST|nr:LOW QUALITY PROTEIN: hypothetical protein PoB_002671000 [Plakobranchus ocellatus]